MLWSIDSCQKGIRWPVSHDCIAGSSIQLIEVTCFLKIFADQLLILIELRLRSIMKRPHNKKLINFFRSVITEMQLLASGVKNWLGWTLDVSCYLRVWRLMQLVSVLEGSSTFLVPNPFSRPSRFLREKPGTESGEVACEQGHLCEFREVNPLVG